jgi:hypothetical protein
MNERRFNGFFSSAMQIPYARRRIRSREPS